MEQSTGSGTVVVPIEVPIPRASQVVQGPSRVVPTVKPNVQYKDPPTYEEVINPDAPPPSYEALFGRVTEAHAKSKNVLDFLKSVTILLFGGVTFGILLLASQFIPICLVFMGAYYLFDCPQGEYIPVFILVTGLFGILKQLLYFSARVRKTSEEVAAERRKQTPTQTLLDCFMLCWFIIGSIWVYEIFEPNYEPSRGEYCDENLYMFAYWFTTSVYVSLGILTICMCTISVASLLVHKCTSQQNSDSSNT